MNQQDLDLGMDANITRRDFIDGVALTAAGVVAASAAGAAASLPASAAAPAIGADYPPMRVGLRGFDPAAIDAGHALRDGKPFDPGTDTGEVYDLVVVGAGMAGLSAAYFYRKEFRNSKVLVLDGCDDFGGHARRNEFNVNGRQLLANGGTFTIHYANTFPPEGKELMRDIGVDIERFIKTMDSQTSPMVALDLRSAMFFNKEKYGSDRLVTDSPGLPLAFTAETGSLPGSAPARQSRREFLAKTPFSEAAKADFLRLYEEKKDYMAGISTEEKVRQLKKMTYIDFLKNVVGMREEVLAYVQNAGGTGGNNQAAGPETFSAWYAYRRYSPGFEGMGLPEGARQISNIEKDAGRRVTFPDGNAGLSRLLVRWLVPEALPGTTMEDSVAARVKYDMLDRPGNDARIRLSSTCIRARHLGDPLTAKEVEVTYLRDGRPYRVRAGAVVMACFNAIVPYLVPELPEAQKAALHLAVRKPLVSTAVAIRNWRAFQKLGVANISCPGMFFTGIALSVKYSIGDYKTPSNPDEPIIVTMNLSPDILEMPNSGLPPREQWKGARAQLLATSFETIERNIRSQLDRVLGPGGFSSRRDIAGIIVNRWGHAYAGGANELYDPDWSHRMDAPWVVGRRQFGRIAISNSDAAAVSLTQAAWAQSHRAVKEIVTNIVRPVYDFHWSERDTAGEPGDAPNNF